MPELRICAYNVLAQTLATSSFFPYASAYLKRATRLPRTLARIAALDADVLCISEAYPDVVTQVEASGYGVLYKARAGRPYGVCLAWRAATLECTRSACLDLDDVAEALGGAQAEPSAEVFRTNSLAIYAALRFRGSGGSGGGGGGGGAEAAAAGGGGGAGAAAPPAAADDDAAAAPPPGAPPPPSAPGGASFCVGTSHFFWDPSLECVKAAQAVALKLGAAEFAAAHCPGRPLLLAGDFNSMPESWVCRVLGGSFPAAGAAGSGGEGQWDVQAREAGARGAGARAWQARLRAQLHAELGAPVPRRPALQPPEPGTAGPCLRSLYALARGSAGEPQVTTVTAKFAACIDYIYALEGGGLDLAPGSVQCVPLPTKAELGGPIPSALEPSDHLPLCATVRFA